MTPTAQDETRLLPIAIAMGLWSPDGETIVVPQPVDGGPLVYWALVSQDGQPIMWLPDYQHFADAEAGAGASWSPDGDEVAVSYNIIFQDEDWAGGQIYIGKVDGSSLSVLPGQPDEWAVVNDQPAWSPDGRTIAFVSRIECMISQSADCDPGDTDLFIVRTDGSRLQEILPTLHQKGEPSWSPDGKHLMFRSEVGYLMVAIEDLP